MTSQLSHLLENDNHELRAKMKQTLKDPVFGPLYNLSLEEERELAYQRLKKFLGEGHVSVYDFQTDPRRIFAAHEILGLCDGSVATKLTVQMNLFGGTLLKFGNKPSFKPILDGISALNDVGCFGLTELGYGNNAVEMETTATFDEKTDEFIIHSPTTLSQKYWITNGYCHAHWAIVFAQLIIKDESYGVHGFLVPIREKDLKVKPGVTIQDMGYKIGLNGVDNARLWFKDVRVPRENLLDAFSQVNKKGEFSSSIKGKRSRFIKMADQLLSGRVCIASMTIAACRSTLYNTIRYSQSRLGVNSDGKSSAPLMVYQLQQKALMPLLAETYALTLGLNKVKNNFAQLQTEQNAEKETSKDLIKMCCVIKPMVTWHAENTATVGRERCGGQGYLACNRFGEAIAGAHAGITAEGDNSVLMQKVAKELLEETTLQEVIKETSLSFLPGAITRLVSLSKPLSLVKIREKRILSQLALKMQKAKGKEEIFQRWMTEESDLVQDVALSYGERFVLENFSHICKEQNNPLLKKVYDLYGAILIKKHLSWYLQEGILNSSSVKKLDAKIAKGCRELGERLEELLDGFGIPSHLIYAPIAKDWQTYNDKEDDNVGEVSKNHPFNQNEKKQKDVKKETAQKNGTPSSDKKTSTTKKAKGKAKAPVKEPV